MPSRNILKFDVEGGYYHIYGRGVSRMSIFNDADDNAVFLNLFKRYLSTNPVFDKNKNAYPHYFGQIELVSFCLMKNHFHLLIYQEKVGTMTNLMRSVLTSYSIYFNKKYDRSGPLLESRYKASLLSSQSYLEHISRYIHLNPSEWRTYEYSSLPYYLGVKKAEWLVPEKILELFKSVDEYEVFLEDYESQKAMLKEIKDELANTIP